MKHTAANAHIRLVGSSTLPPEQLMPAVVADPLPNMFVPWRWAPGITQAVVIRGSWNQVGAQRMLYTTDGHRMLETAVSVRPGRGFIYELSDFTNVLGFLFAKIEDVWWFQADGTGGTQVAWNWILHPKPGRAWLGRIFASQWRRYMTVIFEESLARLSVQERELVNA